MVAFPKQDRRLRHIHMNLAWCPKPRKIQDFSCVGVPPGALEKRLNISVKEPLEGIGVKWPRTDYFGCRQAIWSAGGEQPTKVYTGLSNTGGVDGLA